MVIRTYILIITLNNNSFNEVPTTLIPKLDKETTKKEKYRSISDE